VVEDRITLEEAEEGTEHVEEKNGLTKTVMCVALSGILATYSFLCRPKRETSSFVRSVHSSLSPDLIV
jgi:hypothetical protein